jgi:photosystem II stability/assembly factor-like uncharacterized protein
MKTLKLLLIALTTTLPCLLPAQWNMVYNHGDQEYAMEVVSKDTVFVGSAWSGRIHQTTNGGQGWSFYQTIFTSSWFNDMHFPTKSVGYACGGTAFGIHKNFIAKTTNGGQTWDSLTSNSFTGYSFMNIHFANATTGFVSGEAGLLLKTTDGGTTFTSVNLPNGGTVTEIDFPSVSLGFFATQKFLTSSSYVYSIVRTTDLGNTWNTVYTDTMTGVTGINHRTVNRIQFLNNIAGYACGGNGLFLKTTNGGVSWTVTFISPFTDLTGLHFTTQGKGYINNAGGIYKTTNDGASWAVQNVSPVSTIGQIAFANDTVGYAVGSNGVFRTFNGGQPAGVANLQAANDLFYPNPATQQIHIVTGYGGLKGITIYDLDGRSIKEITDAPESVDISDLTKGVYFVCIKTEGGSAVKKLIVE